MKNIVLANKARLLKETEQGESQMCRAVEELIKEEVTENNYETALKMLGQKEFSFSRCIQ